LAYSFRQLEAFYWVARLGSFRAAARQLGLTQPTVSLRIKEFEKELNAKLFDRSGYRPRPTPRGNAMVRQAEEILSLAEEIRTQGQGRDPLHGLLRIGASDSFALVCLPELLRVIERQFPALRVEVSVAFSRHLNRQLTEREADIAFLTQPDVTGGLVARPLGNVDLAWVASPRMTLPDRALRPTDLLATQIVTNPSPSHLYQSILDWFATEDLRPPPVSTCNSLSIMIRLCAAGFGISVLPVRLLSSEFEAGVLRPLAARPRVPPHTMYVAHHADDAGPGIDAVIRAARDVLGHTKMLAPL
jgi:DNA-binding transcriptional LysR family regulator